MTGEIYRSKQQIADFVAEAHRVLAEGGVFVFIDLAPERLLSRIFCFGYPIVRRALG
jgi:fructose-1,6-bisphosphatase